MKDIKDMALHSKMKAFAKLQLKKRWLIPLFLSFITITISTLLNLPLLIKFPFEQFMELINTEDPQLLIDFTKNIGEISSTFSLLSLVQYITNYVLTFSCICVFLQMTKTPDKIDYSEFLKGFNSFLKAIGLGLWIALWTNLWMIVIFGIYGFVSGVFEVLCKNLFSINIVYTIGDTFLLIATLIIFIRKILSYSFAFFILAEHKDIGIRKALTLSKIITKNKIKSIFILNLSFVLWYLIPIAIFSLCSILLFNNFRAIMYLGLLIFYIFAIIINPYINLSNINLYHVFLQETLNNKKLVPEDFE